MPSDRPLLRTLIRLGLRARHGARLAHAQDWWPGLALEDAAVTYRGRRICGLLPAETVTRSLGPRATIIGSGPSIRDQRIEALEGEGTICLNGAISLRERLTGPVVLAVEDERFVWRHADMIRAHLRPGDLCLFATSVLRAWCEADPGWLAGQRVVHVDNLLKPYRQPRRTLDEVMGADMLRDGDVALSLAPGRGIVPAGSVAVTALQFALPGATRIGLAGIDLGNAAAPRFYEARGKVAFSGIERASARIAAHIALAGQVTALECYSPVSVLRQAGIPFVPRLG